VHACIGPRATHADVDAAQSAVEVAFWEELGALKLNTLRLSEEPVAVHGAALCSSARSLLPCCCSLQPSESCAARPPPSLRLLQPAANEPLCAADRAGFYRASSHAALAAPFQLDSQSLADPPPRRPVRRRPVLPGEHARGPLQPHALRAVPGSGPG